MILGSFSLEKLYDNRIELRLSNDILLSGMSKPKYIMAFIYVGVCNATGIRISARYLKCSNKSNEPKIYKELRQGLNWLLKNGFIVISDAYPNFKVDRYLFLSPKGKKLLDIPKAKNNEGLL